MRLAALLRFRFVGIAAVCLLVLASCSSAASEMSVEFVSVLAADQSGTTFTASGEAVDEGAVCASGESLWLGNLTIEGDPLSDDGMHELFSAGEAYSIIVQHEYVCDDGSGSFLLNATPEIDPALEETQDAPIASATWEIIGGTGDYETLTGSGTESTESLADRWTGTLIGTVTSE